jgi:hypothetical protein
MAGFRANFLMGLVTGAALAVLASFAGTNLLAVVLMPARASMSISVQDAMSPQTVNRAGKSNRLYPTQNVTTEERPKVPAMRPAIPEGCDPAFSPLSKGAASNFSSRCLADNSGERAAVVAQL